MHGQNHIKYVNLNSVSCCRKK